jgi:hypothetical protein
MIPRKRRKYMEILGTLEKKIEKLVTLVKDLRLEKISIESEVVELQQKVQQLESSLLKNHEVINESKVSAQRMVDALITDIDKLLAEEER